MPLCPAYLGFCFLVCCCCSVLFLKVYLFIICKYTVAVFRHPRRQHQISLRMVEPLCGCWDLNSGPLVEQSTLLIAESSLQPYFLIYLIINLFIVFFLGRVSLCSPDCFRACYVYGDGSNSEVLPLPPKS